MSLFRGYFNFLGPPNLAMGRVRSYDLNKALNRQKFVLKICQFLRKGACRLSKHQGLVLTGF